MKRARLVNDCFEGVGRVSERMQVGWEQSTAIYTLILSWSKITATKSSVCSNLTGSPAHAIVRVGVMVH
jgi:hypothetical protein